MPPSPQPRVLFVQPFGLGGAGGGARILRSMLKGQPLEMLSINSDLYPASRVDWITEHHVPIRPRLGRLDRGRLSIIGYTLEVFTRPWIKKKLLRVIEEWQPDIVHILPHWCTDFHLAWRAARERGCRVVMSVHDDIHYTLAKTHPLRKEALEKMGEVWRDADHVFAISQELGDAYASRYGDRPYEIITDGLDKINDAPTPIVPSRLNVYYMGTFHYTYRDNLRALTRALSAIQREQPDLKISLTLRCDSLEKGIDSAFPARVLPFASQETVVDDMAHADLLYLPLPFGPAHEEFIRYSMSTKMVSYLASGVPILFHGPKDAAAGRLLERHHAALTSFSLDESALVGLLKSINDSQTRNAMVENALMLARTSFPLEVLRQRFLKGLLPT